MRFYLLYCIEMFALNLEVWVRSSISARQESDLNISVIYIHSYQYCWEFFCHQLGTLGDELLLLALGREWADFMRIRLHALQLNTTISDHLRDVGSANKVIAAYFSLDDEEKKNYFTGKLTWQVGFIGGKFLSFLYFLPSRGQNYLKIFHKNCNKFDLFFIFYFYFFEKKVTISDLNQKS